MLSSLVSTLLSQGLLTGYELGKRSPVPLSRSYDILERLTQKDLALAQPGEPPRYAAIDPRLLLGRVRLVTTHTPGWPMLLLVDGHEALASTLMPSSAPILPSLPSWRAISALLL